MSNQSEKINNVNKQKITKIWDRYIKNGEKVIDLKGDESLAKDFDFNRNLGIEVLKDLIEEFLRQKIDLQSFKSSLDSENKINNYWGFSAIKGQMFFNQLVNSQDGILDKINDLLIKVLNEPYDIEDAKNKIKVLENFVNKIYGKTDDKRKSPKPSSIPYFLSYFWQVHNYKKWPIYYTSLINYLRDLELWIDFDNQYDNYEYFYNLIYTVKKLLETHYGNELTHWDAEHCFWWDQIKSQRGKSKKGAVVRKHDEIVSETITTFKLYDYIPPIISDLIEMGEQKKKGSTSKGFLYEKKVSMAFKMLDFVVEELGQGKGREPDLIATCRSENIAFIIDAKAWSQDYSIGTDDRAIREYINKNLPKLKKEGYQKNGFIIVSSSFKGGQKKFIDEITLETDIKRLTLLTSEALLYLVAFKLKGNISITDIANTLLKNGIIEAKDIIEAFEDV